jgi:hypothetical protein
MSPQLHGHSGKHGPISIVIRQLSAVPNADQSLTVDTQDVVRLPTALADLGQSF